MNLVIFEAGWSVMDIDGVHVGRFYEKGDVVIILRIILREIPTSSTSLGGCIVLGEHGIGYLENSDAGVYPWDVWKEMPP